MLVISDVHYALDSLRRVVTSGEPVLILGDLVNLTDYRTGEGALADVLGIDFARQSAAFRAAGRYDEMRALWSETVGDDLDAFRSAIGDAIAEQYVAVRNALEGGHGYVIHGNVDRPGYLEKSLPDEFEYVHGRVMELEGLRFGFAGGGVVTPLKAEGEVSDEEMEEILSGFGSVDVLCTHVPPAVPALRTDVITGRVERGSEPILRYIEETQPRLHLFGDVHQPQATTWRIGATLCRNAGYFRATGTPLKLDMSLSP